MVNLLFSAQGRINRGRFWFGVLLQVVGMGAAVALFMLLRTLMPSTSVDGGFKADGVEALPYLLLMLGCLIAMVWSGICLGVKRYHDRSKSGAWILVQFVPLIGSIWYLVEAGCLAGTPGSNRFGLASLAAPMPGGLAT